MPRDALAAMLSCAVMEIAQSLGFGLSLKLNGCSRLGISVAKLLPLRWIVKMCHVMLHIPGNLPRLKELSMKPRNELAG